MHNRIWFMALVLGAVGFVAGLALSQVNELTGPIIEQDILERQIKPTLDVTFGEIGVDNDFIADRLKLELGKDSRGRVQRLTVFRGVKGGSVVGAALQTKVAGFGGDLEVLTVFDLETKKLLAAKALSQSETPGLGARVADDNEPFIKQFKGMAYQDGVALKANGGQLDAISGATVSAAAFTDAVNLAIERLAEHSQTVTAK